MDLLKEMVSLGMGVIVLTREKAEKAVNELVKQGKLKRKEGKDLIEELIKKGSKEAKGLESGFSKMLSSALSKLDIASKKDIRRLENEIEKIKSRKR